MKNSQGVCANCAKCGNCDRQEMMKVAADVAGVSLLVYHCKYFEKIHNNFNAILNTHRTTLSMN